nr:hypothetical protein [uncultured Ruminococcus sp.]
MATKYMYVKNVCGVWHIQADGYPWVRHYFMSRREAIKSYRRSNGLVGKHFCTIEL